MVNPNVDNLRNSKHDCLDCENYRRKSKEAEQTLSGRDVLIDMLQNEIKKVEELYKKSIDDYEKLRFIHCTKVQELSNFKEVHKRVEEYSNKLYKEREVDKRLLQKLQIDLENWKNQYEELQHATASPREDQNRSKPNEEKSLHETIVQEVSHIEALIQNQNDSVKEILIKVLEEIKNIKSSDVMGRSPSTQPDGDSKDKQIEELNQFVGTLKAENEAIKSQLTEKKTNLCRCLCAMENNHSSIANLSGNIEMLVSEKERFIEEIAKLNGILEANKKQLKQKDQEVCEMKCAVEREIEDNTKKLQEENTKLKKELNDCKEYIEQAVHAVEVKGMNIRNENTQLRKELTHCQQRIEQASVADGNMKKLQDQNAKLQQELKESKKHNIEQTTVFTESMKKLQDENSKIKTELKECRGHIEHMKHAIEQASYSEQNMRKDLDQNEKLKQDLKDCRQSSEQLRKEHLEKEQTLNSEKHRLLEKIKEMEDQSCALSDTLEIVIVENKTNLQKIPDLNHKLKEINKEMEECKCKLRAKITELEKEREEYKAKIKVLEDTLAQERDNWDTNKQKEKEEVSHLSSKLKTIERQLQESSLENVEFEEENKYYCQKIESLLGEVDNLKREKSKIYADNMQKDKQIKLQEEESEVEQVNTAYLDSEKEKLKDEIGKVEGDNARKENTIKQLNNEISILKEHGTSIQLENEDLRQTIRDIQELHTRNVNEITHLKDDIITLKKNRSNNYEVENEELRERIGWMEAKLIETIDESTSVDMDIQDMQRQVAQLQKEISGIQAKSKKPLLLEGLKQQEVTEEQETADSCIQVCLDCAESAEHPTQSIQQEDEQKEHLLKENDTLKKKLETYQNMCEECDCNTLAYQGRIMDLQATVDRLEKEIYSADGEVCQRQCQIHHLEQCVDKGNKILAECEKQLKDLHGENGVLKTENGTLKINLEKYVYKAQVTKAENETLREKLIHLQQQMHDLVSENSANLQQQLSATDEAAKIMQKYNLLLQRLQEKDEVLKEAQKKIEGLQKASHTNLAEYERLRRAYRDIKDLLLLEIDKYNRDTLDRMDSKVDLDCKMDCEMEVKARACLDKYIKDLELEVLKKENIIKTQQHQIDDLTYDISQMKETFCKVVSENKSLKNAINNLLKTLLGKLKDFNIDNVTNSSAEGVVHDILTSLVAMEKEIKHTELPADGCNCMSVIMSTYNIQEGDPILQNFVVCDSKCNKRIRDLAKYENMTVGSSSEVLNICQDCCGQRSFTCSREDVCQYDANWCTSHESANHEQRPRKADPDDTEEPFIIEPDTQYTDG